MYHWLPRLPDFVGIVVFVIQLNNFWLGLYPCSSGIFRHSKIDISKAWLLFSNFLTIFPAASAIPLPLGWVGLLVMWWTFQLLTTCLNSFDEYCGTLSVTSRSRMPCLANCFFKARMTVSEDVSSNSSTSQYQVKWFTTMRKLRLFDVNRSLETCCHLFFLESDETASVL